MTGKFGPKKQEMLEEEKELEKLIRNSRDVRMVSLQNGMSFMGKIHNQDNKNIYLKPYTVFENIPHGKDNFLTRIRLEKEYSLPLPKERFTYEALSKGYIQNFIEKQNYFNSIAIKDKELRNRTYDKNISPLPDKKRISLLEKEFKK